MRKGALYALLFAGVLLITASSRSDVASTSSSTTSLANVATGTGVAASPEPITGTAVTPAPGWETPPRDPFSPYPIGPTPTDKSPKPFWSYADLKPEEQAIVDQGRDTTAWPAIHNAYADAVAQQAQRAAASSSEAQLGINNLAGTGVVP